MDSEKKTHRQPSGSGDIEDPSRPIIGTQGQMNSGLEVVPHRHVRAQLAFAAEGVIRVITDTGTWLIPPQQAVWIPGNILHHVVAETDVLVRHLHIDASVAARYPTVCAVMDVPPLVRELIKRVVNFTQHYSPDGREARLVHVLMDELEALQPAELYLPLAKDRRILRIMQRLMQDPANEQSAQAWAQEVGASRRTLTRLFQKETNMSFNAWRKQLRLQEAINRLSRGDSVTNVALSLGYASPSAFVAMFRQTLGKPPKQFFQEQLG